MAEKKEVSEQLAESSLHLQNKIIDLIKVLKDSQASNEELNKNIINLTKKQEALLDIFETATEYVKANKEVDPLLQKLEELTNQNKDIARALILIERSLREQQPSITKLRVPKAP